MTAEPIAAPVLVLQILTNGAGEYWPVLAYPPGLPADALQQLSAMLSTCAAQFAEAFPPSPEISQLVSKAAANGRAILEAEAVVRAAKGGA